jgi:hypothetical protein
MQQAAATSERTETHTCGHEAEWFEELKLKATEKAIGISIDHFEPYLRGQLTI